MYSVSEVKKNSNSYLGNRFEFKYVLSHAKAARLQNYIEKVGLLPDTNMSNGPYIVNSMYFETPFMDDYCDKDASLLIRKKMRARMYDATWSEPHKHVWMEIKGKRNFRIRKLRARVTGEGFEKFISQQNPLVLTDLEMSEEQIKIIKKFSYLYMKGRYSPHVIVKYNRAAYLDLFTDKIRVTFDSNICACFAKDAFEEQFMSSVYPDKTVMEVKFMNRLPSWFTKATAMFDISRVDFSKYNHSVARLRDLYRIPVSK